MLVVLRFVALFLVLLLVAVLVLASCLLLLLSFCFMFFLETSFFVLHLIHSPFCRMLQFLIGEQQMMKKMQSN